MNNGNPESMLAMRMQSDLYFKRPRLDCVSVEKKKKEQAGVTTRF